MDENGLFSDINIRVVTLTKYNEYIAVGAWGNKHLTLAVSLTEWGDRPRSKY